jgi:hypothetical protein
MSIAYYHMKCVLHLEINLFWASSFFIFVQVIWMNYMPSFYSLDNGIALGENMYSMLHYCGQKRWIEWFAFGVKHTDFWLYSCKIVNRKFNLPANIWLRLQSCTMINWNISRWWLEFPLYSHTIVQQKESRCSRL